MSEAFISFQVDNKHASCDYGVQAAEMHLGLERRDLISLWAYAFVASAITVNIWSSNKLLKKSSNFLLSVLRFGPGVSKNGP